jgi:hypothetical protein
VKSVTPGVVSEWRCVQLAPARPPVREMLVQQRDEPLIVMRLNEVDEFMNHEIFEALHGLFRQFEVQPDAASRYAARTPLSLHPLDAPSGDLNAQASLPFRDERRNGVAKVLAKPTLQYPLAFRSVGARSHVQFKGGSVPQHDFARPFVLHHAQAVTPPTKVMTL